MKVISLLPALMLAIGANACAQYKDCKCVDSKTGLLDNAATAKACDTYATGTHYDGKHSRKEDFIQCEVLLTRTATDAPHHQCHSKNTDLNNCSWDQECKKVGAQFQQFCWNKGI
jgi:hypothetical protein